MLFLGLTCKHQSTCICNQGCKTLAKNDDQVAVVESSMLPFIQQAGAIKFQIVWKIKIWMHNDYEQMTMR